VNPEQKAAEGEPASPAEDGCPACRTGRGVVYRVSTKRSRSGEGLLGLRCDTCQHEWEVPRRFRELMDKSRL
jgi:DNA-directed RNA polymerase subunit M/transcription elongation factor TFIIS